MSIDIGHVRYEFSIVFSVSLAMSKGIYNSLTYNVYNVAGFCASHNLIGYFRENGVALPDWVDELDKKIVRQITTLTQDRTHEYTDKLKDKDMIALFHYFLSRRDLIHIEEWATGIKYVGQFKDVPEKLEPKYE